MEETMLDKLKEFLKELFSRELLEKIVGYLGKAVEYIGLAIEYIRSFIGWLYEGVTRLFRR